MITRQKNKAKQIKHIFNKSVDFFLDLIFPKFCFGCQKEGAYLCMDCKSKFQINHFPFCPICKNKIIFPQRCSYGCKSQIKLALSPFSYDDFLIKDLIHNFKYNFVKSLGIDLGDFLIESIKKSPLEKAILHKPENFLIIPVPLHRRRLVWRGFNQSEILAKKISEYLNIKSQNILKRIKNTKPQIEMMSADERFKNIQNAFAIHQSSKLSPLLLFQDTKQSLCIKNKTIIIVDDMLTTGATLEECAKILKQSGAKEVWAITVAK